VTEPPGRIRALFACRLCVKVALAVFVLILAIESIILVPSALRYERVELERVAARAETAIEVAIVLGRGLADRAGLERGLAASSVVDGIRAVAAYGADGTLVAAAGTGAAPSWIVDAPDDGPLSARVRRDRGGGAALVWWRSAAEGHPRIVARLDTMGIDDGLVAYLARIGGLIALIVLVVTGGTMIVLHRTLLRDLLRLRRSAIATAQDPVHGMDHAVPIERDDELGDVIQAFNLLLERVAIRTDQLERANQDLESFSQMVSHDLSAPLRSIDGFASILEDATRDRLDPEAVDALRRVRAAAARMKSLIEDLMRLARIDRTQLARAPTDLAAVARAVIERLERAVPGRQVEWAMPPQMPVDADAGLLEIVMTNLLGNAWKFTSKRDRARIEIGIEGSGSARTVFVRDNGAGFDAQHADRLFKPFQRLHTPREFEGTGIGLAIVDRIIARHGGRVWAQSGAGDGATFRFTLGAS